MQLKDILDICRANEVEHFEYTVVNGDINTTVYRVLLLTQEK